MAQGFSQRLSVDYQETFSPVRDAITLHYLINFIVHEKLKMHLMNVVTTYLYESLDNEIYMKVPEEFLMPKSCNSKSREMYSIIVQISLYDLK